MQMRSLPGFNRAATAALIVACLLGGAHVGLAHGTAAQTHPYLAVGAVASRRQCPAGRVRLYGPVFARSRDVVLYRTGNDNLESCYIPTGQRRYLHSGYAVVNLAVAGWFAAVVFQYVICANDCDRPPPAPPGDPSWSITQVYDVRSGRTVRKCFCESNILVVSDSGVAAWASNYDIFVFDRHGARQVGTVHPTTFDGSITFAGNTVHWKDGGRTEVAVVEP
jgi:hypothetical protein